MTVLHRRGTAAPCGSGGRQARRGPSGVPRDRPGTGSTPQATTPSTGIDRHDDASNSSIAMLRFSALPCSFFPHREVRRLVPTDPTTPLRHRSGLRTARNTLARMKADLRGSTRMRHGTDPVNRDTAKTHTVHERERAYRASGVA
jgi:hypothetical protein